MHQLEEIYYMPTASKLMPNMCWKKSEADLFSMILQPAGQKTLALVLFFQQH